MTLTLKRTDFTPNGIFSILIGENNEQLAVTLEHSYNSKPKLYDGTFICVRGVHRLHNNIPFETFEVTGVTGHSGILFHVGNYNKDSDGCILVGDTRSGDIIQHSLITFSKLLERLNGIDEFTLLVC